MKRYFYVFGLLIFVGLFNACEKDHSLVDQEKELIDEDDCFFNNECLPSAGSKSNSEMTDFTKTIQKYYADRPDKK